MTGWTSLWHTNAWRCSQGKKLESLQGWGHPPSLGNLTLWKPRKKQIPTHKLALTVCLLIMTLCSILGIGVYKIGYCVHLPHRHVLSESHPSWPQTAAGELPICHQERFSTMQVLKHWNRLVVESPPLETFRLIWRRLWVTWSKFEVSSALSRELDERSPFKLFCDSCCSGAWLHRACPFSVYTVSYEVFQTDINLVIA